MKNYIVMVGCFNVTVQARTQKEANYKAVRKIEAKLGMKHNGHSWRASV